jgi:hypothetical protein
MKKVLPAILLMLSSIVWAAGNPDTANYSVSIHVSSSKMVPETTSISFAQVLNVIINGRKYELRAGGVNALLALGDYKARLVRDDHRNPYDAFQVYELLFSDKKTRKFEVVGQWE